LEAFKGTKRWRHVRETGVGGRRGATGSIVSIQKPQPRMNTDETRKKAADSLPFSVFHPCSSVADSSNALQRRPSPRPARLDTRPGRRQHLARATAVVGVEGGPQPRNHVQVFRGTHIRYEVALF